jgi:hypothetical protein
VTGQPPLPLADAAQARAERRLREAEAEDALGQVHGVLGLQAALLALLLPAGSPAARQAWQVETGAEGRDPAAAEVLRAHVGALSGATRLPWLERLAIRMRSQPIAARRALLMATRRLMSAHGTILPIDRLHWLALRQWLGEPSAAKLHAAANGELEQMVAGDVYAVARYTAFLTRLVPGDAAGTGAGRNWYAAVMAPWASQPEAAFDPPDADTMVSALLTIQSLAWMHRPMLLRSWVDAALAHGRPPNRRQPGLPASGLHDSAADALRLTGALLDSPLPPELARHYSERQPEERR